MRTKTFIIPKNLIALFFDQVDDNSLETTLCEITKDEELVVDVLYETHQREEIMNLIELVEDSFESPDEEEESEEYEEEEEEREVKPKRKPRKKSSGR